jgi:chemotaxis family two-component system response regulator Rcp1
MKTFEILMVEDNAGDARLMKEVLNESHLPYRLSVVSDGVEAIAFLKQVAVYAAAPRPDLILLDLNLPRKNGLEVLDEIKSYPHLSTIPVLVLTNLEKIGLFNPDNLLADGFVNKPSELNDFGRVIEALQKLGFNAPTLDNE